MSCGLSLVTATTTAAPLAATATRAAGCGTNAGVPYAQDTVRVLLYGSIWGVPICKVVLLIQSCLGMAWVSHGMGCSRAELHVGQVQGRSVAASQACKVGAREWAASATIEPRVWDACTPCLACWACWACWACPLWPAGPPILALLAVSLALGPSPIQQTEYAIGLPYSQPSQSRLQRPSRPHLARFSFALGSLLLCRNKRS